MSAHTPGPWVRYVEAARTVIIMPAGRLGDVARLDGVSEADARLIAAAPEMFGLLEEIEDSDLLHGLLGERIHVVIAKARGGR